MDNIKTISINQIKPCYKDKHTNILIPFIKNVLNKGFKVWTNASIENCSYFFISNNNRLVYIQKSYFSGIDMSTKHKPNRATGGGHRIIEGEARPNIRHLNKVLNKTWEKETYFKDIKDYVNNNNYYSIYEFKEVVQ